MRERAGAWGARGRAGMPAGGSSRDKSGARVPPATRVRSAWLSILRLPPNGELSTRSFAEREAESRGIVLLSRRLPGERWRGGLVDSPQSALEK